MAVLLFSGERSSAIKLHSENKNLSILRTFGSETEPECVFSEALTSILLFDEKFVDDVVFQESQVIKNAFEVFIQTPEYIERQKAIEARLQRIHFDIDENADIKRLVSTGQEVLLRLTLTKSGEFANKGLIKNLKNSGSIFVLPEELKQFKPLMEKDYTVKWVSWKHDGSKYDDNQICPFCAVGLNKKYGDEKKLFTSSYTKSNVESIIEMLSYFNVLEEFMEESKREKLRECIETTRDEAKITYWIGRFYSDLKFLVEKITNVIKFNSFHVQKEDIPHLDELLNGLLIDTSDLEIFNNKRTLELIQFVNSGIKSVLKETATLKREIGELQGLIFHRKKNAVKDINNFLSMADINYEMEIIAESETTSKTILKYVSRQKGSIEVDNIRLHLSWGERNAFALILFMHYAISYNPDLIILDDPISSFDSNKKYAIISRLFSKDNGRESFYKKTVLMLTHDLQPMIDFIVINKPTGGSVRAYFIQNQAGAISEHEISEKDIKSFPFLLAENSRNEKLNKIHRVASLRKLLNYLPSEGLGQDRAYNLLSCLMHGRTKPCLINGTELTGEEIKLGEEFIKPYIIDFKYTGYSTKIFSKDNLLKIYVEENNSYLRLQIFRILLDMLDLRTKIQDDILLKYVDEQFHVENDYMFSLDFVKYNLVPNFVVPKCTAFLINEHLIPS